jgi:nucleoid-associated protein YgaU
MAISRLDDHFRVDQPRPHDIVDNPIAVAGAGGGFEGHIEIRVIDGNGDAIVETSTTNTNLISQWQHTVGLMHVPATSHGLVEVGPGTGADESPPYRSIPVVFGIALVHEYTSHYLYTVQSGDTLAAIAAAEAASGLYGGTGWQPIHRANHHIVPDPDKIRPGMVLRIPTSF